MGELSMARMGGTGIECGSYVGTGSTPQTISTGKTPKWVLVATKGIINNDSYNYTRGLGGLAVQGIPAYDYIGGTIVVEIVDNGFRVSGSANLAANAHSYIYGT